MNQIKCPHCGKEFTIDESSYDSIVKQIRDHQFNEEIALREKQFNENLEARIRLVKAEDESRNQKALNDKEKEIEALKNRLESIDTRNALENKEALEEIKKQLSEKENIITRLNGDLANKEYEAKLKVNEAIAEKEKEITELKAISDADKDAYRKQLADKDELIAYYKDFKAKQSTKMIGEDLEQHCLYEFNRVRPLFKNAYFEKDNDASLGSKGDFIFRDFDEDGTEIVSIMFEMKNEADETATKHKNEDFLAKLDKDRKDKGCEYAVLVSLLEMDNDTYNEGIVDMSHRYEKMYVIRPQNFIAMITLLRNANLNSLGYKKQLIVAQNQDLDYRNFENNMNAFKDAFGKNYATAAKKFQDAIDEIDKSISHLQKIKDALTSSSNQLRLANDKAQDLSIRKLTKNAPSIADKFKENEK
ncbi:MAG: DUF2130 domain-containing protein [Erysipelotrichaceae bacterium]|nr:DUF2130 domain-containing protein [Erysipelotrichaceae bacterium]